VRGLPYFRLSEVRSVDDDVGLPRRALAGRDGAGRNRQVTRTIKGVEARRRRRMSGVEPEAGAWKHGTAIEGPPSPLKIPAKLGGGL
jgi:hypothetical protein